MKKFGLFSCGTRNGAPYLNYEVLWTPMIKARLESHAWLSDSEWPQFLTDALDGEVFDGHGTLMVVKLRDQDSK